MDPATGGDASDASIMDADTDGQTDLDAGIHVTVDSGPEDSGVESPRCTFSVPDALFCDGFERDDLEGWRTDQLPSTSTTTILQRQGDKKLRGRSALRARMGPGDVLAVAYATVFTDQPPRLFWVRAYFYFPRRTSAANEYLVVSDAPNITGVVASTTDDDAANLHSHPGAIQYFEIKEVPPLDVWLCVEMKVEIGSTGEVALYWDGAPAVTAVFDVVDHTLMRRINVGAGRAYVVSPNRPNALDSVVEVYVDEVVVSTTRPGCPLNRVAVVQ